MDNEEKRDDILPNEDGTQPEESAEEELPAKKGSVVIENFDEEKDEDEKRYEQYISLMNEEEEDDIASVAERITGERHSRVSTAAPIRIRENPAQTPPSSTHMPIRPIRGVQNQNTTANTEHYAPENIEMPQFPESDVRESGKNEENRIAPAETNERSHSEKNAKGRRAVATSALVLVLVLALTVAVVNVVLDSKEKENNDVVAPPSFNEEILTDENASTDETSNDDQSYNEPIVEPETDEPISPEEESSIGDNENTAGDLTEDEQPEPIVEPEPEPEYTVTLDFYDRDDIVVTVPEMTLAEVYAFAGYTPREGDRPSVGLDTVIAADAYVTIDTAEYKNVSVTEVIPYDSEVIELDTIPRGDVNYLNAGENGEAVRTYTVEYINGAEVSRTLAWEETTKTPVNERYELGVGGSFVGADGVTYTYSYRRTVPSTYYSIEGLTYLGTMADESVIAVDPDKIPLGTTVYVKNDTYDFGVRTAADVGPKVEEWEVDVWLSPSNPQYASYAAAGYHYDMEIYYID